jgi:hypothetical protein
MNDEKKHKVHNLIILDESGSMMSIKRPIIQGFNELVQTIKGIEKEFPEQEHFISFITFNGLGQKVMHFAEPVMRLDKIDDTRYRPDSLTPLFDAMGYSFGKLRTLLENEKDYNVLVTILTDGEENASREYTGLAIKNQIQELEHNGWTFTYIGTNHDVMNFSVSISISNSLSFSADEAGMKKMFLKERQARLNYSKKIRDNKDAKGGYYDEDNNDDKTTNKNNG